jgi:signal transduction histidine kinase/ActR/RegA family two-component response regulator
MTSQTFAGAEPPPAPVDTESAVEASLRLFIASSRNVRNRMVHATAMLVGSAILLHDLLSYVLFAAAVCVALSGSVIARRTSEVTDPRRRLNALRVMFAMTFANSCVYAGWFLCLWRSEDDAAQLFALVMVFVSFTYLLMQYYAAPRTFIALLSPYLTALLWTGAGIAVQRFGAGHPWIAVSIAAAAVGLANFLRTARRQLDYSRSALRDARAQARRGEQSADAANVAKSAFLATMSHEIRTPLNGVLGMAQAMQADELTLEQRGRIAIVQKSGETLLAILNDILDLSKIEAGRLTLETVAFDLGEIAGGAHAMFCAVAQERGIAFRLNIDDKANGQYVGDPTRVRQILHNLASNALKFTNEGEVCVHISALDPGIRIAVSDTGEGIAPEVLGRLFDKFVQADASITRRHGGTGLGLSICRDLAQMMGGEITAESELGQGSTFAVDLPLPRLAAGQAVVDSDPEIAFLEAGDPAGLRVLAAEDNAVNQLVLKTLLGQVGIELTLVENGELAVEAWRREPWDLILMDIQMPVMDGMAATRLIRAAEAATSRPRTPIIALSANVLTHQIAAYAEAGMDGHLAKPIEVNRLFDTLQAILQPTSADTAQEQPGESGSRLAV